MTVPPLVDCIFRYRTISSELSRERQILVDNLIWFSSPSKFNDPFDARPLVVPRAPRKRSTKETMRLLKEHRPDVRFTDRFDHANRIRRLQSDPKAIADYISALEPALLMSCEACSVCCFNAVADDIRMWSYYSAGHAGYCLGYRFGEGFSYVDNDGIKRMVGPARVAYVSDYPVVDPADLEDSATHKRLTDAALLTKSDAWKWESETRLVRVNAKSGLQPIPAYALKYLILGARIDPKHRDAILNLMSERNSPLVVLQAFPERERFALRLEPI